MLEELLASAADEGAQYRPGRALAAASLVNSISGPMAMESLGLWARAESMAKDKKAPGSRQAAAMYLGAMGFAAGNGFEPYMARAIPLLLSMLSDGVVEVRDAAILAAADIMRAASRHGCGRAIPLIVDTLKESKWTCKVGSLQLLSAVAEFAPHTLYAHFPAVMPPVRESLAETHPKVSSPLPCRMRCPLKSHPPCSLHLCPLLTPPSLMGRLPLNLFPATNRFPLSPSTLVSIASLVYASLLHTISPALTPSFRISRAPLLHSISSLVRSCIMPRVAVKPIQLHLEGDDGCEVVEAGNESNIL